MSWLHEERDKTSGDTIILMFDFEWKNFQYENLWHKKVQNPDKFKHRHVSWQMICMGG